MWKVIVGGKYDTKPMGIAEALKLAHQMRRESHFKVLITIQFDKAFAFEGKI